MITKLAIDSISQLTNTPKQCRGRVVFNLLILLNITKLTETGIPMQDNDKMLDYQSWRHVIILVKLGVGWCLGHNSGSWILPL
jgi:hypothetical protein